MESVLRSNSIPPVVGAESVLHLNLSLLAVGLELALRSNSILLVAESESMLRLNSTHLIVGLESMLRLNSILLIAEPESMLCLNLILLIVGLESVLRSNSILLVAGSGLPLYLIPMVAGLILLKFLTQILEIVLMTQLNCFHSTFQQMRSLLRKLNIFCFLTHSTC